MGILNYILNVSSSSLIKSSLTLAKNLSITIIHNFQFLLLKRDDAVTEAKIVDAAVSANKLASASVTTPG